MRKRKNDATLMKERYKAWDDELQQLDVQFEKLRTVYEQYFAGLEKVEPLTKRDAFNRAMLRSELMKSTKATVRFRFITLQQRYASYRTYWDRVARQIEEGTFKREGFGKFSRGPLTPGRVRGGTATSKRDEGREANDVREARAKRVQETADEASAFLDSLKENKGGA